MSPLLQEEKHDFFNIRGALKCTLTLNLRAPHGNKSPGPIDPLHLDQ